MRTLIEVDEFDNASLVKEGFQTMMDQRHDNAELEAMLLNAFQLIKNGKCVTWLKFDQFKELVKRPHDHNGKVIDK